MIGKLLVGIITHSFNLPCHLTRLNDSSLDSNSEREGEKKTSDVVSSVFENYKKVYDNFDLPHSIKTYQSSDKAAPL